MKELPAIPGGWMVEEIQVEKRVFQVTKPAVPDEFLDDPEVLAASQRDDYMPYWPYLWPAAYSMARTILQTEWPPGIATLELGTGIGLVGLAALSQGLDVTLSDYQQTAVDLAMHNARQNGFVNARGCLLDWRHPTDQRFSVILGCDLVYETANHQPILQFVQTALAEDGVCWLGDPGRFHAAAFIEQARQSGFAVELLDAQGNKLTEPVIGVFQLIILNRS